VRIEAIMTVIPHPGQPAHSAVARARRPATPDPGGEILDGVRVLGELAREPGWDVHRYGAGDVEARLVTARGNTRELRLPGDAVAGNTIYRGCMGRLLMIVLAVIAAFMLLGVVISALHFIFWVAVVALIVVAGLRLTGSARRWSRR